MGQYYVEDDVGMGRSRHDPKIVDAFQAVHFRKCFGNGGFGLVHLWIVGFNRVHVSDEFNTKRVLHLPLYIVDDIVVGHDIAACIHFDMSRRKDLPGSVVMHHQIVDAKDAGIFAYDLPNAFHQMGIRCFPQQGTGSFSHQLDAGPDDKQCDQTSHVTIDLKSCKLAKEQAGQNRRRCDHIVSAVRSRCCQGHRLDLPADAGIKQRLPQLDQDRGYQHTYC